ncbi:hypothetical protein GYMLUDRAFT_241054 [Collybiopsis luxurians FD-317 M1]|nr:hypothetical protein GYMLUDRAFT_241054 [Collybiopsis luxurians FD-317 M1]
MTNSLTEVEESRVLALTESPGFMDLNPIAYLPSNLNEAFKDPTKDVWNIFWHLSSNTALEFISRKTYELPRLSKWCSRQSLSYAYSVR